MLQLYRLPSACLYQIILCATSMHVVPHDCYRSALKPLKSHTFLFFLYTAGTGLLVLFCKSFVIVDIALFFSHIPHLFLSVSEFLFLHSLFFSLMPFNNFAASVDMGSFSAISILMVVIFCSFHLVQASLLPFL